MLGAATVTAATGLLVYAITTAAETGLASARTLGLFAGAFVAAGVFVVVERRATAPLVPFRVLRSRVLVGGNLVVFAAGMAVDGMLITLTSFVQRVVGWSAIQFALLAAACLLLAYAAATDVSPGVLLAGLFVFGAGMGGFGVASPPARSPRTPGPLRQRTGWASASTRCSPPSPSSSRSPCCADPEGQAGRCFLRLRMLPTVTTQDVTKLTKIATPATTRP